MASLARPWGHLHYRFDGPVGADVLVFVNSLGTDRRIWDDLVQRLPGWRTLTLDLRGQGLSATPDAPWTIEDLAGDVVALLDALDIARAVVVGCSLGGLVAQALLLDHPARIRAAVLSNTAPKIGSAENWQARIDVVTRDGMAPLVPLVMERWFPPAFVAGPDCPQWATLLQRADPAGYAGGCRALAQADFRDRVGSIARPVLVLAGSHDQATPPDLVADFACSLPGARFHLIEGAGHLPAVDRTEATATVLTAFLGALDD